MSTVHIAGWAILALLFVVVYVSLVAAAAQIEGLKVAFLGVTAIWIGAIALVALLHFALYLIKS